MRDFFFFFFSPFGLTEQSGFLSLLLCKNWHKNCCVALQEDCGEGCSQGLPGVPGMAGAKGEKGDIGKPGITPLDSCDKVRD